MRMFSFKGGIHPPEYKELSCDSKITNAFPSGQTVTIPVTMGGAPNECVVQVGERVVKGQVIAKTDKYMSAPVHASVTGVVKSISPHIITGNSEAPCITIQAENSDEVKFMEPLDPFSCTKQEALDRIRDAGIVGMGGASFPTHVKLNPAPETKIEYIILNAAECEPYLTIDHRQLKENAKKVVDGLAIEMHLQGGAKGIIALESNKLDVLDTLNGEIARASLVGKMEVRVVETKYPQGCEKNLTLALFNREVPSGGLPAATGCIISNVGTVCAISDAFRLGKPLIERPLTISGGACKTPMNICVPVGTVVSDLIPDVFDVNEAELVKILSGGPMMGFAMKTASFPIAKGTSGVLFLTKKEVSLTEESLCIGCGRCVEACPLSLNPVLMKRSISSNSLSDAKFYGLMDCIECGSCSFVCPSHIRLVQHFRNGKALVRAQSAGGK